VTPMNEADLLIHLSRQTDLGSGLVDLAALQADDLSQTVDQALQDKAIVLLDVESRQTQARVGEQIWRVCEQGHGFVVGSSGVEYALLAEWAGKGIAAGHASFAPPGPVERLAVVSGSVSPTTEKQIRFALAHGFDGIQMDAMELVSGAAGKAIERAVASGLASLAAGRSVILYTALGPQADRSAEIDHIEGARNRLGRALGDILRRLVLEQKLGRAVIAGGDTSSHALGQLSIDALTVRMPLPQSPGSPLCIAHGGEVDGLEIALKGGQVGTDRYFSAIRDGLGG